MLCFRSLYALFCPEANHSGTLDTDSPQSLIRFPDHVCPLINKYVTLIPFLSPRARARARDTGTAEVISVWKNAGTTHSQII